MQKRTREKVAAMTKEERQSRFGNLKGKPWPEKRRAAYNIKKGIHNE